MPLVLALIAWLAASGAAFANADCQPGRWIDPATGLVRPHDEVLARAAARGVVLLGETHDDADHHRWQLSVLAGLLARQPGLAVGFEALPARVQPVLDRWVAGELDEGAFLAQVGWKQVWGVPAELYLPLFHLARLHRLPAIALNVDRALITRVGREGWAAVPAHQRQGVGDPAAAPSAYRERLAGYFAGHGPAKGTDLQTDPAFGHFVDAQLTWDRGMAEALARAKRNYPLVIAIVGSEHARFGDGIPHQLEDLGVADAAVLLPHPAAGCEDLQPGEADAVFLLEAPL